MDSAVPKNISVSHVRNSLLLTELFFYSLGIEVDYFLFTRIKHSVG